MNRLGKDLGHEITMECTHHGPFLSKPAMFIEIGSHEEQWINKKAGDIIAKTIVELLEKPVKKYKTVTVLGGGHYNHTANKIMLNSNYAVGHICPKYMLEVLNENLLRQAIERTTPKAELVVLDWKGLGEYKQKVVGLIEEIDTKYKKVKEILSKPL